MPPLTRQWRSWQELADDPLFLARAAQEFPSLASALSNSMDRRRVLKLMAAAFAMGGLSGCDLGAPSGVLISAVNPAPGIIAGRPNFYATAHVLDGMATGILVKHQMGRPIKVEGNPHHPASMGATSVFAQAIPLDFYDPDRSTEVLLDNHPGDWQNLVARLAAKRNEFSHTGGAGLRILTGTITSPTLGATLGELMSHYPEARWHQWDARSRDSLRAGALTAYGTAAAFVPKLDNVDVLLAIDSDLLESAPGHLKFARDFAARRNPTRTDSMSRVYAVESTPGLLGAAADHRFAANPAEMQSIIAALAQRVLRGDASLATDAPPWISAVATDLLAHPGRALVHVGPDLSAEVHALVHAINDKLGGRGSSYELLASPEHTPVDHAASLQALTDDLDAGKVDTVLIVDVNPVYSGPGSLDFARSLEAAKLSISLSVLPSETSRKTRWALPMAHDWETWSDACAYDGTATIMQPQALPLYNGKSPLDVLALFYTAEPPTPQTAVRATWQSRLNDTPDGAVWHAALAAGVVTGTRSAPITSALRGAAATIQLLATSSRPLHVVFKPDAQVWDGRYANNAWLQELPRPLTKLTWDNPLLISPSLAQRLSLRNGDHGKLSVGNKQLTAPVWIVPGQAADCITATLGFGRALGRISHNAGTNTYPLTGLADAPTLEKVVGHDTLACTEHHDLILNVGEHIVRHGRLADFQSNSALFKDPEPAPEIYRHHPPGPAAWGMSIDLNACIGCNACAIACQAENNVPVVGKEQVIAQREMHWLRVDRYWEGSVEAPDAYFQPMLCMHCEQAPCETVCPVGATVHDAEGLNVMVYNRCVGTRFCSNNCPYKVRRFNYLAYADEEQRAIESRNPDVTVRMRGVMEKCTFCVQRIAEARIAADEAGAPVGPVQTACQGACPSRAITFGNLADPGSEVSARKKSPLNYAVLGDQNTHPRVTYEGRIRNLNPDLAAPPTHDPA
jgi:MoCo/4Fe-4S cofactor protein with predicted Tat translocation signal